MTEKVYRICGEAKTLEHYYHRPDNGQRQSACKPCHSKETAAKRYGLTVGDVDRMREDQGNRCAICKTHADDIPHTAFKHNPLVIDHCHTTGKVRGLLCPTCNAMLGHAKDNVAILSAAITYLSS